MRHDEEKQEKFRKMINTQNLTEFEMDQIFLGEASLEEHIFGEDDDI